MEAAVKKHRFFKNRKRWIFFGASLLLGIVLTWITYPGILYSDSYGRWSLARELLRGNRALLDDWLSFPPQIFMAICYAISGEYGLFTVVQATLFFFVSFCAIDSFCPKGSSVITLLYAACPVFYGFSVYIEMSVGCVTALLALLMLILKYDHTAFRQWTVLKKIGYCTLCLFLYFCMIGFRQNAFTVLPILIFALIVLVRKIKTIWPLIIHAAAIALSFAIITAIPSVLNFGYQYGGGSKYMGFLWEMTCMVKELPDRFEYISMFDYLGEEGSTLLAAEHVNYDSVNSFNTYLSGHAAGKPGNGAKIMRQYFMLMREEPEVFWRVKGAFLSRTMGVREPLMNAEYDYDRDGRMGEFGVKDTDARKFFHSSYNWFQDAFTVFRMPWAVFSLALLLLLATRKLMGKEDFFNLCILFLSAVFFYGSFLISTQSQEFRYFFASLVLLWICIFSSVGAIFDWLVVMLKDMVRLRTSRLEERNIGES